LPAKSALMEAKGSTDADAIMAASINSIISA
jgi:hypothetical protein